MPATGFEDYQAPNISTLLAAMPSGPSQDYQSARFGLTGQYPTDVQQNEAEAIAARLAGSPYERANALAHWVSGANIAAGVPGPRFGSVQTVRPTREFVRQFPEVLTMVPEMARMPGRPVMEQIRALMGIGERPITLAPLTEEASALRELTPGMFRQGMYMPRWPSVSEPMRGTAMVNPGATAPYSTSIHEAVGHGSWDVLPRRARSFLQREIGELTEINPTFAETAKDLSSKGYRQAEMAEELLARSRAGQIPLREGIGDEAALAEHKLGTDVMNHLWRLATKGMIGREEQRTVGERLWAMSQLPGP